MITPQEGVVIAHRYTLTRPLAQGGMGSVWIARHRELDIDVTVKFMEPSLVVSPDARARFEHEARSAARLDSQHVVQVLDYGIESDTPYMVMELLKGETLAARLARERRLPLPAAARLAVQICKALRTAHEAGLVHRDLKPGNVFLALKDEDEVAKVLDFGIAKSTSLGGARGDGADGGGGTEPGMLLGSMHYMSPEQIRNSSAVDHRGDLWSLAVILYRTLTGRLPFPGKDFGDVLVRVCTDPIPPPTSHCPDLPVRVDGFFERALDRDPARRFQSARDLAEAFCTLAMDAATPSSRPMAPKTTLLLDMTTVPPAPPSSDSYGGGMETSTGTVIVRNRPSAIPAAPATVRLSAEFGPTLKAGPPDPPAAPPPAATPAPVQHEEDAPEVPVHAFPSVWAAVVAVGVVVIGAAIFAGTRSSAPPASAAAVTAPSAPPAAVAPTVAVVTPPAAPPSPIPAPVVTSPDAGFARPLGSPMGAPPPNPRAEGSSRHRGKAAPKPADPPEDVVVDGIVRDPFAR